MTTVLRYHKRAGRFGREVRDDQAQTTETRPGMEADRSPSGCSGPVGYAIDADAIAAAIIDRLVAGGTIAPPGGKRG